MTDADAVAAVPAADRRALLVAIDAAVDGAACRAQVEQLRSNGWQICAIGADELPQHYGEDMVAAMAHLLRSSNASLLLAPWPAAQSVGMARVDWSVAAFEAARRVGGRVGGPLGCLPCPEGPDLGGPPWPASELDNTLLRLCSGARHWPMDRPRPDAADVESPLVSVVVRSMDRPSLAMALDSIALQTHRALDVVVVNAAGRPHSALGEHGAGLPMRLVNADGAALPRAAAANAGLEACLGRYTLFLDDDDCLFPDHVHKLVHALADRPDAVAAFSDVDHGCWTPSGWSSQHRFDAPFDTNRLWFENYLPIHAVLFRNGRAHGLAACRFDEQFSLFEDWDFWLQLARLGPFVHVPGISARYVASMDSGSGVFAPSADTAAARASLFAKWHARWGVQEHADFMVHAQVQYRAAQEGAALGARLSAEVADAVAARAALEGILASRDREVAAFQASVADLQALVGARDVQLAATAQDAASLRDMLAALREHAAGLERILAARNTELANLHEHAAGLDRILAARDAEISALKRNLSTLLEESPVKALRRTLRKNPR